MAIIKNSDGISITNTDDSTLNFSGKKELGKKKKEQQDDAPHHRTQGITLLLGNNVTQKRRPPTCSGWANLLILLGGDDRDRTDGLSLAKAALSQLSYIPSLSVI